jgi:hypothetical protein
VNELLVAPKRFHYHPDKGFKRESPVGPGQMLHDEASLPDSNSGIAEIKHPNVRESGDR